MNTKLLLDLFRIGARSGREEAVAYFIQQQLKKMDIPFETDVYGNVFSLNHNNVPLLSAHMDAVQDEDDAKLAGFVKLRGTILSGYGVIGGDDKCGIYIILEILKIIKNINFIFSVEEEVGGQGIKGFVRKNGQRIKEICLYGLILDRRGNGDIICEKNSYGSKEFDHVLCEMGKSFKYSSVFGALSDADSIKEFISCANLSVGYYNPHSKQEFVNTDHLNHASHFAYSIVKNLDVKYPAPVRKVKTGRHYRGNYGFGGYDSYDYGDNYYNRYSDRFCKICNYSSYSGIYCSGYFICNECHKKYKKEIKKGNIKEIVKKVSLKEKEKEKEEVYEFNEHFDDYECFFCGTFEDLIWLKRHKKYICYSCAEKFKKEVEKELNAMKEKNKKEKGQEGNEEEENEEGGNEENQEKQGAIFKEI